VTAYLPALLARPVNGPAEQQAARRVLSGHIYTQFRPSLLARYELDAARFLIGLLDSGPVLVRGGSVLGLLVVLAVVVALLRLRLGRFRQATAPASPAEISGPLSARRYRELAAGSAAAGEWDAAVTSAMRALARGLEERDIVAAVPGRTAHELAVRAGASLPAAAAALHAGARAFDEVRYGGRVAGEPAFRAISEADRLAQAERPQDPDLARGSPLALRAGGR
jgi:hypothetical protein